jgi:hypothetical protein
MWSSIHRMVQNCWSVKVDMNVMHGIYNVMITDANFIRRISVNNATGVSNVTHKLYIPVV